MKKADLKNADVKKVDLKKADLKEDDVDMSNETLSPARVVTKANIFGDGHCVSHTLHFADGSRKTVGVILPSTLVFDTSAAEVMEGVAGDCEYRLNGAAEWIASGAGEKFSVPAHSRFEIRTAAGYHYICHFG